MKKISLLKGMMMAGAVFHFQHLAIFDNAEASSSNSNVIENVENLKEKDGSWNKDFTVNSVADLCKEKGVNFDTQKELPIEQQTYGYRFNRNKIEEIIGIVKFRSPNLSVKSKNILAILIQDVLLGNRQGSGSIDFRRGLNQMATAFKHLTSNKTINKTSAEVSLGKEYIAGFIVREMLINLIEYRYIFSLEESFNECCEKLAKFLDANTVGNSYLAQFVSFKGTFMKSFQKTVENVFGKIETKNPAPQARQSKYTDYFFQKKSDLLLDVSKSKISAVRNTVYATYNLTSYFNDSTISAVNLSDKEELFAQSYKKVQEDLTHRINGDVSGTIPYRYETNRYKLNSADIDDYANVLYFCPIYRVPRGGTEQNRDQAILPLHRLSEEYKTKPYQSDLSDFSKYTEMFYGEQAKKISIEQNMIRYEILTNIEKLNEASLGKMVEKYTDAGNEEQPNLSIKNLLDDQELINVDPSKISSVRSCLYTLSPQEQGDIFNPRIIRAYRLLWFCIDNYIESLSDADLKAIADNDKKGNAGDKKLRELSLFIRRYRNYSKWFSQLNDYKMVLRLYILMAKKTLGINQYFNTEGKSIDDNWKIVEYYGKNACPCSVCNKHFNAEKNGTPLTEDMYFEEKHVLKSELLWFAPSLDDPKKEMWILFNSYLGNYQCFFPDSKYSKTSPYGDFVTAMDAITKHNIEIKNTEFGVDRPEKYTYATAVHCAITSSFSDK